MNCYIIRNYQTIYGFFYTEGEIREKYLDDGLQLSSDKNLRLLALKPEFSKSGSIFFDKHINTITIVDKYEEIDSTFSDDESMKEIILLIFEYTQI